MKRDTLANKLQEYDKARRQLNQVKQAAEIWQKEGGDVNVSYSRNAGSAGVAACGFSLTKDVAEVAFRMEVNKMTKLVADLAKELGIEE